MMQPLRLPPSLPNTWNAAALVGQTWRSAPQVLQQSRYWEDWGAVSEAASCHPSRAHQRPEDDFLHRLCRRDSGVTAAIAQCQLPDGGGILVERLRVARARRLVE